MSEEVKRDISIAHYGIIRRSGRYPWGSGENPYQRSRDFYSYVEGLRNEGLTDAEIARGIGEFSKDKFSTTDLRATRSISKNEIEKAEIAQAIRLKDKGMSTVAIAKRMDIPESTVRNRLKAHIENREDKILSTADFLKSKLDEGGYLDIGKGTENHLGVSNTTLNTAVATLKDQGYTVRWVKQQQLGTGYETNIRVLVPPGIDFSEVMRNKDQIKTVVGYSEDDGKTWKTIEPPVSVNSNRIAVRYGDEGGAERDGVIELRRGVPDISLGDSRYAQVRVSVDDTHYLKGMAMYSDNLPDGVDILFNTNKNNDGNKLNAMKPIDSDPENPFGSVIRQKSYTDKDGKTKLSPLNIVGTEDPDGIKTPGEEGGWNQWSTKLSSQMLSKQSPRLAKEQLDISYDIKKQEFDEIMSYTNPTVRRKLLEAFADGADASSTHLKAAALPRTRNAVILPINTLKDDEVYAPNFNNGETVVLIRHPHGGIFEIPELKVNNRNKEARSLIPNAQDAIGINSRVAQQLSGADFDGDTVLVIPNNAPSNKIKAKSTLASLKDFEPRISYSGEGLDLPPMKNKQQAMGDISNLITDMTIKGATDSEIARAVKHSMVVIDAEKHNLNHKQSYKDHGIAELKEKYQGGYNKGASTIISRAKSTTRVNKIKPRAVKDGGPIDKDTGEKVFVETGDSYIKVTKNRDGSVSEKVVRSQTKLPAMQTVRDAHELSSGTQMEEVYANYANRMKSLANQARKEMVNTKSIEYSSSANKAYAEEVSTLRAKLNTALKNAPLERQAQVLASANVAAKQRANPNMDKDDLKKIKNSALMEARNRTGAAKQRVVISDKEWSAIQAGAISNNMLTEILRNADLDIIKQHATPRNKPSMTAAKIARAKSMLASGYTQAEVANLLGVSTTTLNSAIK